MKTALLQFLRDHYQQLPGSTGQHLMLYIAFVQRLCLKFHISVIWEEEELEGMFSSLFQRINGYEIKEAAVTFEMAMPWSILQHNEQLGRDLRRLNARLSQAECATADWLCAQVELLFNDDNTDQFTVTPYSVRELVAKLAATKPISGIVDVCCGSGSLGLHLWRELGCIPQFICRGEEINGFLCSVARLLLFLCDVRKFSVAERNVLDDAPHQPLSNDGAVAYVADLPLTGHRTVPPPKNSTLIPADLTNTLYTDWFIIQDVIGRMREGDSAFFLVTKGALVRQNESSIRERLIALDLLEAVIHIPNEIYPNHYLAMELLICEKQRPAERKGKVFFADMSDMAIVDPHNKKTLDTQEITRLSEQFFRFRGNDTSVRIVSAEEIKSKEFSLFPKLYFEEAEVLEGSLKLKDIAAVTRGLQNHPGGEIGDRYLLNVRDIREDKICFENAERIERKKEDWEEKYRIKEDDIIITCKGSALKIAMVPPDPPPAYISGNLTVIRVNGEVYSPYLLYEYFKSERGQTALSLIQTGTTIRILGNKNLEQLSVPAYDKGTALTVGDGLKLAAVQYARALEESSQIYHAKRQRLLEELQKGREMKDE